MSSPTTSRKVIIDGGNTNEVLQVLSTEIKSKDSLEKIRERATEVVERSVDPIAGQQEESRDGLIYGLIQSGKTSVITVAAAMAADNGFDCIVVLTSDIDLLYDQTIERLTKALRRLSVLGKKDWKDPDRFERHLRTKPVVIVCSKNGSKLTALLEAFKAARARGLSLLLIDDEADQASLNTKTSKKALPPSKINEVISKFRSYFPVNTYLQVTATPQALFLQTPEHKYRPTFTVLTEPGPDYVGGESFFGEYSDRFLREVDLNEVDNLRTTHQPSPSSQIPSGLRRALLTFLVSAAIKVLERPGDGFAFLAHVSVANRDHDHIVDLIDKFKESAIETFQSKDNKKISKLVDDLKTAYDDISTTQTQLPEFEVVVETIKTYLNGTNIKLVNARSDAEIKLDSVFNIFVGGNKLGRGVTIRNLLTSYYGRNPKKPNADTVLQHARMYGYRKRDAGVTRLFLPTRLADHFKLIHQMESSLRDLVLRRPDGKFEGLFVSQPMNATRKNVLDPNSIGMYVAGESYNPIFPLRDKSVTGNVKWLDERLALVKDEEKLEITITDAIQILERCVSDASRSHKLWNLKTLTAALETIRHRFGDKAYVVVKRGMQAKADRRETQGIITGKGEADLAPLDAPTLFLHRQDKSGQLEEVWWPQLRFPDGNYALAFAFNW
jgi:hypothetical protein